MVIGSSLGVVRFIRVYLAVGAFLIVYMVLW